MLPKQKLRCSSYQQPKSLINWSGREDSNLRPPAPHIAVHSLETRVNSSVQKKVCNISTRFHPRFASVYPGFGPRILHTRFLWFWPRSVYPRTCIHVPITCRAVPVSPQARESAGIGHRRRSRPIPYRSVLVHFMTQRGPGGKGAKSGCVRCSPALRTRTSATASRRRTARCSSHCLRTLGLFLCRLAPLSRLSFDWATGVGTIGFRLRRRVIILTARFTFELEGIHARICIVRLRTSCMRFLARSRTARCSGARMVPVGNIPSRSKWAR